MSPSVATATIPFVRWQLSDRCDPVAARLYDGHYSRQSIGSVNWIKPGACLALRTPEGDAIWSTSWPLAQYVKHEWAGMWECSTFRNTSPHLSSELIVEAISATLWKWPNPPGMVTFVAEDKVRHKRDPGRCFRKAGFKVWGRTKVNKYLALGLTREELLQFTPSPPLNTQSGLF